MYTVVDAALARLATSQSSEDGAEWPDLTAADGPGRVPGWRAWLRRRWSQPEFAAAVTTASPDLARRVVAVCAGEEQRVKRVRSAVISVLRYQLRATGRATPFGRFAGVAPAHFDTQAQVRLGGEHHRVHRADAVFIHRLLAELHACPELVARLPVVANGTAFVRGDRLVLGVRAADAPAVGQHRGEPAEVSVRYTPALAAILHAARERVCVNELAARLTEQFPSAARSSISMMLATLCQQRILISSLVPPMTATNPLAYLCSVLREVAAAELPAAAAILDRLEAARAALAEPEPTTSIATPAVAEAMPDVDVRVDAEITLPTLVAAETVRAAHLLTRLTPHPAGTSAWQDYHHRFLERYGLGGAVPLLELVADGGLGYPAGYRDSPLPSTPARASHRDTALLALAQNAALHRRVEVDLDEQTMTALETENPSRAPHSASTELAVRVHAHDLAALEAGEFQVVVTGAFRAAGTTSGRFLDLLDPAELARMNAAYRSVPPLQQGAVRVQVSGPPMYVDTENVARAPQVLDQQLVIGEHPSTGAALTPRELLVVADKHQLYLWSVPHQQVVEPVLFSAVEFTRYAHPLLRLCAEITGARTAACGPFSWGAAADLPFLPRLRSGRVVLTRARWRLDTTDLPDASAPWERWSAAVTAWRQTSMVPAQVEIGAGDQRLRVDLDEPSHLYLLRAQLTRHGHAVLTEGPPTGALDWIGGRAHEVIVPLASTQPSATPPVRATPRPRAPEQEHLPGAGNWLFCTLAVPAARHTAVLTGQLPELLSTWERPPPWWFLPYRDPEDHLRLRIHHAPGEFGTVAERVGAWAAELRRSGVISTARLDTYHPETGRYGHGPVLAAAESVFVADSAAALAHRSTTAAAGLDPRTLTAASLLDAATAFTGSLSEADTWLRSTVTAPEAASPRPTYTEALQLADPTNQHQAVRGLPGGEKLLAAWQRRRTALTAYRTALTVHGGPDPTTVLSALLHVHCIRVNGIDPSTERGAHRLARAAARSHTTRTRTPKDAP
ncbi:lantibiotic dehydratase [Allokutzneria multivorans]|uniref:Lantibiotic dehydratase n=1 Tax=Allokutzneria multivorans TaxID=1142134 RepID=A0ABP7SCN5_9PSEU